MGSACPPPALPMLPLLVLLAGLAAGQETLNSAACNCFPCKTILEGPFAGSYYSMDSPGSPTGGCLYRERNNGKIIRACDGKAIPGNAYQYHKCYDQGGLTVCREPPEAAPFGYDLRTWDGNRELQTASVRYTCNPPKVIEGWNGSAIYDIWCSAAEFPRWQFTLSVSNQDNQLPLCQ